MTEARPARGMPLLVTAELPPHILKWADALRQAHYPADRNRLSAHVTLFHALPPGADAEVRQLLAGIAGQAAAVDARITGIMDLGRGTALALDSPGMTALHEQLAERLHGTIQQRDARKLRLHITVQNKVARAEALALQRQLAADLELQRFRFRGFGLYCWDGRLWNFLQLFAFRGRSGGQ